MTLIRDAYHLTPSMCGKRSAEGGGSEASVCARGRTPWPERSVFPPFWHTHPIYRIPCSPAGV